MNVNTGKYMQCSLRKPYCYDDYLLGHDLWKVQNPIMSIISYETTEQFFFSRTCLVRFRVQNRCVAVSVFIFQVI